MYFIPSSLKIHLLFLCSVVLLSSCSQEKSEGTSQYHSGQQAADPFLVLKTPQETGITYKNSILESENDNITNNSYIYLGGGVAVADFDNDGLQDVYFSNPYGSGALYQNMGDFKFTERTAGSGLDKTPQRATTATIHDVNGDGLADIYLCIAGKSVSEASANRLYINQGNFTFKEEAQQRGIADQSLSASACFIDYDMDGDLDLFVGNYPASFDHISKIEADLDKKTNTYIPRNKPHGPMDSDRLFQNDGTGHFKDVTKQSGLLNFGYALSVTAHDINSDGLPDLYISNDFIQEDRIYINQGNGTFSNKTNDFLRHTAQHSMGTDIADINNDALSDILTLDMFPPDHFRQVTTTYQNSQSRYKSLLNAGYIPPTVRNVLQVNNGNGTFSEIGCLSGIEKTDWSWSCLLADFDHDGLKDISITNGYPGEISNSDFLNFELPEFSQQQFKNKKEQFIALKKIIPSLKINNFIYKNKGNYSFESMGGKWASIQPSWSTGAAYADFDNDGDLDLMVSNFEESPFVYENTINKNKNANYLSIKLLGNKKNIYAYGSSIEIRYKGNKQSMAINPARGIFSSSEPIAHFGLGAHSTIDTLIIRWPDNTRQILTQIKSNQRLLFKYSEAKNNYNQAQNNTATLFNEKINRFNYKDIESRFYDFDAQFTLPWRLSDLTPLLAKGDVNGDGLADFFVGNQFDAEAKIFLQTSSGTFKESSQPVLQADKVYEDHGAVFFDVDRDKDLDLFVLSGGWEAANPAAWQGRLYINDGTGRFGKAGKAIPAFNEVGLRPTAYDYDKDGDLDLFIGGRVTSKAWPITPRSTVLRNDGNQFVDVTAAVAGDFERCGMVADLAWADLDADGAEELIAVGEWMPISVFEFVDGKLRQQNEKFGFSKTNGFYNCLKIKDLNKDGQVDIVVGNMGLNTRFEASSTTPLQCYAADFDGNGSIDPIMVGYENGKAYPLLQLAVLIKQIPKIKKKFVRHTEYGRATIQDIFEPEQLNKAEVFKAYSLETTWWENKNGHFTKHILPMEAQAAPTQAILTEDFNQDGNMDIFLAGNKWGMDVETGPCDAGKGCMLLGNGQGAFRYLPNLQSGIFAQGDVRDALYLRGKGEKRTVIISNNNGYLEHFEQ